jgi:hypothetical protein
MRGQWSHACETTVLAEYIRRGRAGKDKEIEDTRLRDPMCASRLGRRMSDINPRLGADGVEDSDGRVSGVRVHNWD